MLAEGLRGVRLLEALVLGSERAPCACCGCACCGSGAQRRRALALTRTPPGAHRFNVYVAQPEVKPGCVFRRSNISLLEKKRLVTDKEARARRPARWAAAVGCGEGSAALLGSGGERAGLLPSPPPAAEGAPRGASAVAAPHRTLLRSVLRGRA